jgi:hypothetical protein
MLKTQTPFIKTQLLITTDLKMPLKPGVTKQQPDQAKLQMVNAKSQLTQHQRG